MAPISQQATISLDKFGVLQLLREVKTSSFNFGILGHSISNPLASEYSSGTFNNEPLYEY